MKNAMLKTMLLATFFISSTSRGNDRGDLKPPVPKSGKLDKLTLDQVTKNLEFGFCKAIIRTQNLDRLNELAKLMKGNGYALSLRGHADGIGTYVGNWKMSDYRAKVVKAYLIDKGVDSAMIVTTPFGSTIPVATNGTAQGRQRNRRVEIRLKQVNK